MGGLGDEACRQLIQQLEQIREQVQNLSDGEISL